MKFSLPLNQNVGFGFSCGLCISQAIMKYFGLCIGYLQGFSSYGGCI
jgi:hypothetical protein